MKKIGIMSMQRIINYGSFMQAYGLKKIIEKLGYDVQFVDYKYENPIVKKESTIKKIISHLNIVTYLNQRKYINRFKKEYNNWLSEYLKVNEEKNYAYDTIDELVIGSDEVFNCLQGAPVGYSRELFGKNYEKKTVISYAACFGNVQLTDLKQYGIDDEIKKMLLQFKTISVRDNNSYNIVNNLINTEPIINLDPVLIADYDNEIIDNVKIKDYILVYAYNNRLTKTEKKEIKKYAKLNNKIIVSIGGYQEIADYNLVISPFELFPYFKHADFIITDTFHGSVFSIKTHKKFCTIIRDGKNGNNNKLYDLLNRLHRTDRIIKNIDEIDKLYKQNIDYEITDNTILKEKNKANDYLKKALML